LSPVKMFQCSKLPCLGWTADFLQGFFRPKCLQDLCQHTCSRSKISMEIMLCLAPGGRAEHTYVSTLTFIFLDGWVGVSIIFFFRQFSVIHNEKLHMYVRNCFIVIKLKWLFKNNQTTFERPRSFIIRDS
jgi:hypothetical protein